MTSDYRGRFAPSPSGPLHFGSLVAALGSWADARHHQGEWLVRIEDIDPPREKAGAADHILRTLEAFGLTWDGEILYQSRRRAAYEAALETLRIDRHTYPCSCSRKEIHASARQGIEGAIYPGHCRNGPRYSREKRSVRLYTDDTPIRFVDRCHGPIQQRLESEIGDFILRRTDGLFAYQLGVVVDDAEQGFNQIVRGADLLQSTPRQIHLQQLLNQPTPAYLHLPLVLDKDGRKLSKQDAALPVDTTRRLETLLRAWRFLGQPLPDRPLETLEEFLDHAIDAWSPASVPRKSRACPIIR